MPPVQAPLTPPAPARPAADAAGAAVSETAAPDPGRQGPTATQRNLAGAPASGRIDGAAIGGGGAGPVVVEAELVGADPGGQVLLRVGARLLPGRGAAPPAARRAGAADVPRPVTAGWGGGAPGPHRAATPEAGSVPAPEPDQPEALRPDATLARRMLDLARHLGLVRRGQEASGSGGTWPDQGTRCLPLMPATHRTRLGQGFASSTCRSGTAPTSSASGFTSVRRTTRIRAEDDPKERPQPPAELEDGRPRRAIVVVDFERLGPCQLDLLCQCNRFELQVRSLGGLPEASRRQISGLFRATCDAVGLQGGLQFARAGSSRCSGSGRPGTPWTCDAGPAREPERPPAPAACAGAPALRWRPRPRRPDSDRRGCAGSRCRAARRRRSRLPPLQVSVLPVRPGWEEPDVGTGSGRRRHGSDKRCRARHRSSTRRDPIACDDPRPDEAAQNPLRPSDLLRCAKAVALRGGSGSARCSSRSGCGASPEPR